MRIIYILHRVSPYDGSNRSFLNMVSQLLKIGVVPLVVVPEEGEMCNQLKQLGINYKIVESRFCVYPPIGTFIDVALFLPRLLGRIYANWIGAYKICRIARQFRPDIIHSNVSVINAGYIAARRLHIPHVWHIREYGDKNFNLHFYPTRRAHLRDLHQPGSYTICITHNLAVYNRLDNHPQSRVIYNGIVPPARLEGLATQEQQRPYFLCAGHIEPGKGTMDLVQAYVMATAHMHKRIKLLIIGKIVDQTYYRHMKQLITSARLDKDVVFINETNEIGEYMQRATAVIVPSRCEGFGRVMPEAMLADTLVIARDSAGSKEQLDNGLRLTGIEIGLRYTTQDELVNHIVDISNNGVKKYKEMIDQANIAVKTLYSTEGAAKQVYGFYTDILNHQEH